MMISYELAENYRTGRLKNAKEIGRRIEKIRKKELHLTQLQVSQLAFTSERNYRRWVKEGALTLDGLLLISCALKVNPTRLFPDPGQD